MKDVVGQVLSWALLGLLACLIDAVVACIAAIPVMLLWNWLMPLIFGLPQLTFLEALGVSLLCSLLFKTHTSSSSN